METLERVEYTLNQKDRPGGRISLTLVRYVAYTRVDWAAIMLQGVPTRCHGSDTKHVPIPLPNQRGWRLMGGGQAEFQGCQ
jgi:hypothetical protein